MNKEKDEALVYYFRILSEANSSFQSFKVKGLDPSKSYKVDGTNEVFGGDELEYVGLSVPAELRGDFQSYVWRLTALG